MPTVSIRLLFSATGNKAIPAVLIFISLYYFHQTVIEHYAGCVASFEGHLLFMCLSHTCEHGTSAATFARLEHKSIASVTVG